MGKGDSRRPEAIKGAFDENWERTFGVKPPKQAYLGEFPEGECRMCGVTKPIWMYDLCRPCYDQSLGSK